MKIKNTLNGGVFNGFELMIFSRNEHNPPHIHLLSPEGKFSI